MPQIEYFVLYGFAGAAIGVGIMILFLARWGQKFFGGKDSTAMSCPYAEDHPVLKKFMDESMRDRQQMREILSTVNVNVGKVEGKLDVLLQGARVRWNAGLIPERKE